MSGRKGRALVGTLVVVLGSFLLVWGISFGEGKKGGREPVSIRETTNFTQAVQANEIKIASYNLYNMFDFTHDEGMNDFQYLPKTSKFKAECHKHDPRYLESCLNTDWTKEKFDLRAQLFKKVLEAQGHFPDVLVFQEVENERVLKGDPVGKKGDPSGVPFTGFAEVLGYSEYKITNGLDRRGIDVAAVYKTEKLEPMKDGFAQIVVAPTQVSKPTRNILRLHFRLKHQDQNAVLGVYVNHWPSQRNPNNDRMLAAKALKQEIVKQTERFGKENYYVVVLGDFNVLGEDTPNPIHNVMLDINWDLHLKDAQNESYLVDKEAGRMGNPMEWKMPRTTYWYWKKNSLDKLDRILLSQNLFDGKGPEMVLDSFRVVAPSLVLREETVGDPNNFYAGTLMKGVPKKFDFYKPVEEADGFSDHFMVSVKLRLQ